jgi:DNA-binding NarL/FixJ family response regulator
MGLEVRSKPLSVLIIDDHPAVRLGIKAVLADEEDIEIVGEAGSPEQALLLLDELRPDIVVLDESWPDISGPELTRQLAAALPTARILALSSHDELSFCESVLLAGAARVVLKSVPPSELRQAVRDLANPDGSSVKRRKLNQRLGVGKLSEREAAVLRLFAQGLSSKEMSPRLGISPRTLETYKARAMLKLALRTRADVMRLAVRCGWLDDT